jgi:hypothetical protein
MKAVTVGTTPTLLDVAGNRDFLNIYNNDSQPIFIQYDGSDSNGASPTTLTPTNGWPIPAGGQLYLSNDGHRNVYNKAVYAISVAGGADVRVQGA